MTHYKFILLDRLQSFAEFSRAQSLFTTDSGSQCSPAFRRVGASSLTLVHQYSQVRDPADLVRDVIKADSAAVLVPELDMELGIGTLGGLVTTVEVRGGTVPEAACLRRALPCM